MNDSGVYRYDLTEFKAEKYENKIKTFIKALHVSEVFVIISSTQVMKSILFLTNYDFIRV